MALPAVAAAFAERVVALPELVVALVALAKEPVVAERWFALTFVWAKQKRSSSPALQVAVARQQVLAFRREQMQRWLWEVQVTGALPACSASARTRYQAQAEPAVPH